MGKPLSSLSKGKGVVIHPSDRDSNMEPLGKSNPIWKSIRKYARSTSCQVVVMMSDPDGKIAINATDRFRPFVKAWFSEDVRRQAIEAASRPTGETEDYGNNPVSDVSVEEDGGDDWVDVGLLSISGSTSPRQGAHGAKRAAPRRRPETGRKKRAGAAVRLGSDSEDPGSSEESEDDPMPQVPEANTTLTISDEETITQYYLNRFRQMQQLNCKTVAKAWIKVIEVKKQSSHPYNRGEESRPEWWPPNIRHKEPDHLKKNERMGLLLSMLRCPRVTVRALELATADVVILPQRAPALQDIYRLAKQEERYRKQEIPATTQVFVPAPETFHIRAQHKKKTPVKPKRKRPSRVTNPPVPTRESPEGLSVSSPATSSPKMEFSPDEDGHDNLRARAPLAPPPHLPAQNPFSVSSEQHAVQPLGNPVDYNAGFVQTQLSLHASGPHHHHHNQQSFNNPLSAEGFYLIDPSASQHTQRHSVSFAPEAEPVPRSNLRRPQTMSPIISQQHTPPVYSGWPSIQETQIPSNIYSSYSPGTHSSQGPGPLPHNHDQPSSPVSGSPFHGLQSPSPALHEQRNLQAAHELPSSESSESHFNMPPAMRMRTSFTAFLHNPMENAGQVQEQEGLSSTNH